MVLVDFAVPKSDWPPGPWHDEPDRLDFEHAGLSCLALRNRFGAWCGYVAVPPGHPFHGTGYNDVPVEVHGGLTYASTCNEPICHELKPGQPDGVWWLGFDCGHFMDVTPGITYERKLLPDIRREDFHAAYRDLAYVRHEIESLAEQLSSR